METKPELPWGVFHVISTILARFIAIQEECKLTMPELYVLAFMKHSGRNHPNGKKIVLRGDITQLLGKVFNYSPKQVNIRVTKLRRLGCIKEYTLNPKEKKIIYGIDKGQMKSLILLSKGYKKIDEFTLKVHQVYLDITGPLLPPALEQDDHLVQSIAEWLLTEKKELGM
jgi:hypothetical protein